MEYLGVLGFLLGAFAVARVVSYKGKISEIEARLAKLEKK